ncbi:MAG: ATP-dependent DNA helicase RecQ, partial [Gammaproteobacteria bacterium HGW-Gammaproteobacteria-7]
YQETGRAGRDGEPAEAWLCYGLGEVVMLKQMIESSEAGEDRKRLERQKLDALLAYCESTRCRRQTLLGHFQEDYPTPCGNCDNCLEPPQTWDATVEAQKALSCVYRSGQRFGVGHLIDILRGSDSARIHQLGHDRLSTYGIGADLDANEWRGIFRQLLATDSEGYGGLRLTAAAGTVLRGERPMHLRRNIRQPKRSKMLARERSRSAGEPSLDPHAQEVFERLRQLRSELARGQNVPAYVIFHDATLRAIAQHRPSSRAGLAAIQGVGAGKLERYGDAVLAAVDPSGSRDG